MSMLWRVQHFFDGGGRLLKAEARLAAEHVKHAVVGGSVVALACIVALVGGGVLLAGAALALSTQIGWPWTLCVIGGVLLIGGLLTFAAVKASLQKQFNTKGSTMSPVDEAAYAKQQMHEAVDPDTTPPSEHGQQHKPMSVESVKTAAVDFVSKNPSAIASGAFVALSLIGPFRAIRLLAKGAALAGLAATIADQVKKERESRAHEHTPGDSQSRSSRGFETGSVSGQYAPSSTQHANTPTASSHLPAKQLPAGGSSSTRTPYSSATDSQQSNNRRSYQTPDAAGRF
jgi:hypothetical protein